LLSQTLSCAARSYLNWVAAEGGLERDGRWSCGTHDYPSMHHSLMHPCANNRRDCCGDSGYTPFLLRYESFFHSKNALLVLAYEARAPPSRPLAVGLSLCAPAWLQGSLLSIASVLHQGLCNSLCAAWRPPFAL
jgi:hypothetical protein